MNMPTISVAVPTCGRPHYLEESLNSIMAQTRLPDEIVVSEDGADLQTKEIIDNWKRKMEGKVRLMHVSNTPGLGQLANRQQAIQLASGDYIAMLDDDDMWFPPFLEKSFVALKNEPEAAFCSANHSFMDDNSIVIAEKSKEFEQYCGRSGMESGLYRDVFRRTLVNKACVFSLHVTLFRSNALKAIGYFQAYGGLVPDYALFLKLGAKRFNGIFIKDYLGSCRIHNGQQSKKRLENSVSKVECLTMTREQTAVGLNQQERELLEAKLRAAILECSIAYAHENRRRDALRQVGQMGQVGYRLWPFKRWAVLMALMAGVKK
ncbi:glycosyltransferase family A protein [Paenibacillus herberti]|uniref:Glycosyltransferase 2-like domain-containing protein n=1 Tax=Paenibacillus herberti TaxID=1619309 RepID=A0A229NVE2_9BACL|nr:glycosyltransferase family A protein [Paenibacillus herberti]OXM13705.1 hypothetical protein CGZ75_22055 [Paenibacillus herberti]